MDGSVAEVLLYDGSLTPTDSSIIQDYLNRKYFGYALDTEMDDLPDTWEMAQFGNLTSSSGGSSNFDGDRCSDTEEWITGTSATDPSSFFSISITHNSSGGADLIFSGIPERTYTLEQTGNLTQTNGWVVVDTLSSLSSAGQQMFSLAAATNGFARVRVSL